jgi:hypothetical protein
MDGHKEFNQLKYVNRQLRQETTGLEVKHNTIRIEADLNSDPCGVEHVRALQAAGSNPAWLKYILIRGRAFDGDTSGDLKLAPGLKDLSDFCRQYPGIKVTYVALDWTYTEPTYPGKSGHSAAMPLWELIDYFLKIAMALDLLVHCKDPSALEPSVLEQYEIYIENNSVANLQIQAPNLSFRPKSGNFLDFKQHAYDTVLDSEPDEHYPLHWETVEEWFEVGIQLEDWTHH